MIEANDLAGMNAVVESVRGQWKGTATTNVTVSPGTSTFHSDLLVN